MLFFLLDVQQRLNLTEESSGMDWKNRNVLVTGGTSFIGAGIVDALILSLIHI